jgi:hypothetical protein
MCCTTLCKEMIKFYDSVQVNGRIMRKRIHVRVEHIVPSRCREDFLKRRTEHENLKKEAKAKGGAYPRNKTETKTPPELQWCSQVAKNGCKNGCMVCTHAAVLAQLDLSCPTSEVDTLLIFRGPISAHYLILARNAGSWQDSGIMGFRTCQVLQGCMSMTHGHHDIISFTCSSCVQCGWIVTI